MGHTISVSVENRPGVLARIASLFSARGFNISSLTVGETDDPTISRMIITLDADERILEQVIKQLRKLIDVIKVQNLTTQDFVERELVLIKMDAPPARRMEIMQIVSLFRAKVVDVSTRSLSVEVTGDEKKIKGMLEVLKEFGIKEIVRTGKIAMVRGK